LDIGPGGGSITRWLSDRVGPDGSVTAIDLQPDHVTVGGNVDVVRGDIRYIDLPAGKYDLIHMRLVGVHLSNPERVLHRLVPALAPGGLLVVSEWDVLSWRDWLQYATSQAARAAFDAFQPALFRVLQNNGADLSWAGKVPVAMRTAGLEIVGGEGFTPLAKGGEAVCLLHESNSLQLHHRLVATGLVTADQLRVLREATRDPQTLVYGYQMFSTVGRRPDPARVNNQAG
jgi:SAM-dependent methyltransferase